MQFIHFAYFKLFVLKIIVFLVVLNYREKNASLIGKLIRKHIDSFVYKLLYVNIYSVTEDTLDMHSNRHSGSIILKWNVNVNTHISGSDS